VKIATPHTIHIMIIIDLPNATWPSLIPPGNTILHYWDTTAVLKVSLHIPHSSSSFNQHPLPAHLPPLKAHLYSLQASSRFGNASQKLWTWNQKLALSNLLTLGSVFRSSQQQYQQQHASESKFDSSIAFWKRQQKLEPTVGASKYYDALTFLRDPPSVPTTQSFQIGIWFHHSILEAPTKNLNTIASGHQRKRVFGKSARDILTEQDPRNVVTATASPYQIRIVLYRKMGERAPHCGYVVFRGTKVMNGRRVGG
jgi:hypothetical protein